MCCGQHVPWPPSFVFLIFPRWCSIKLYHGSAARGWTAPFAYAPFVNQIASSTAPIPGVLARAVPSSPNVQPRSATAATPWAPVSGVASTHHRTASRSLPFQSPSYVNTHTRTHVVPMLVKTSLRHGTKNSFMPYIHRVIPHTSYLTHHPPSTIRRLYVNTPAHAGKPFPARAFINSFPPSRFQRGILQSVSALHFISSTSPSHTPFRWKSVPARHQTPLFYGYQHATPFCEML